jgi:threonine/homoserine/homoserine lactone efflux protein
MFGIHDLPLFILAGLLLNITPGPDMAFFCSRAASQGVRGGVAAVVGICAGCAIHTIAATIGLSAILLTSAEAFFAVKIIGAAYLIYVGISMLRERATGGLAIDGKLPAVPFRKIFLQGFFTNVLNPKVALFYLAFLPQFIDVQSPEKSFAFLLLGVIFIVNSLIVTLPLVWVVARASVGIRAGSHMGASAPVIGWLNKTCGALFVVVGIKLALTERPV